MLKSTAFALSFIRIPICVLTAHFALQFTVEMENSKTEQLLSSSTEVIFLFSGSCFFLSAIRLAISVRAYFDTFIYFVAHEHELLNYQDN